MSIAEDLLAAVLAAPDDDTPRLVYADWLIEHGDPRGELINIQIAEARDPASFDAPALRKRAQELLAEHGETWSKGYRWATFRRGFVENLFFDPGLLAMEPLLACEPVTTLTIHATSAIHEEYWEALAKWRPLASLRAIEITANRHSMATQWRRDVEPRWASATNILPIIDALGERTRALRVCGFDLREICGELIERIRAPLEQLVLEYDNITPDMIPYFATAHVARHVRVLGLSNNPLGDFGAQRLAELVLPRLDSLSIGATLVQGAGISAVCASPLASQLRWLALGAAEVPGMPALESGPYRDSRGLPANAPGGLGIGALASAAFPRLEQLDLSRIELDDDDAAVLAGAEYLPRLRGLALEDTRLGPGSLARFPVHLVT